jgi:hypothetical protein
MLRWQMLVMQPERELARLDIAAMNLACAEGLPGADRIDWEKCLTTLDRWADSCRRFTAGVIPHFRAGRCDYPESEQRFRIQAMVTHLQRDLGMRYHPDRREDNSVFQPEDSFVHGVTQGEGGTCGNMPVLYAAVGRRLNYPIMLASSKSHLYCRWDGRVPGVEAFNIEASGDGVSFVPDDYYRTGRYAMPPETVEACGFLKTLFYPREELASFLGQRAECWMQEKNYGEAAIAFAWANEMHPTRSLYGFLTDQALRAWKESQQKRLPRSPYFPKLDLGLPASNFRHMPREAEREMIGMMVWERLIDHPRLANGWWRELRSKPYQRPVGLPEKIPVDFRWTGPDPGSTHLELLTL